LDYKDLVFYQKARQVVKAINKEVQFWMKSDHEREISRQLFRSATSVGANIAEGHGRHAGLEYIHYLLIAQGSANEVDHWLNTALDCEIGNSQHLQEIIHLNNETRKMLAATISTLKNQRRKESIREDVPPIPFTLIPLKLKMTYD